MAYTRHGHQIPGTMVDVDLPVSFAKCGGPGPCAACSLDVWGINAAREDMITTPEDFEEKAHRLITEYIRDKRDQAKLATGTYDVTIEWVGEGRWSLMARASTSLDQTLFFEVTYNAEKRETRLDVYRKFDIAAIAD